MKLTLIRIRDIGSVAWFRVKHAALVVFIRNKYLPVYLLCASLFTGCLKDDFEFNKIKDSQWQPELAVPLAFTSMSISDLMKSESDSGNLVIDSNNFCTLIYEGRALKVNSNDLVNLPDQNFTKEFVLNDSIANYFNSTGQISFSYDDDINLSFPNGILLDSATFKYGTFWLSVNVRVPAHSILNISIPAAVKNGIPFSTTLNFQYAGSLPISQSFSMPLTDYKIDFTRGGITHNSLRIHYDITATSAGVPIHSYNKINTFTGLLGNGFSGAFGYFGQQNFLSEQDSIQITLFDDTETIGTFHILKPEIKIDFNNSIGIPVRARITSMTGLNSDLTSFVQVAGTPDPLPIYSPTINQFGQTITGSFVMTKNNSNVYSVIENKPKFIITQVESMMNPDGNTGTNFVTDSSNLTVDLQVKLPLYGTAENFKLRDTLNFNYNNLQNLESLMIRTNIKNGFPFEAHWQVYFADDQLNILDSLVKDHQLIMPSAQVNAQTGKVTTPSQSSHDNTLDRTRILKILNAKKLLVKANASTINQATTNVKIYADYTFDIQLGAIAKIKM